MLLSEEWLDSVSSRRTKESSITSWVLPFPKSWREDFKPSSPRESSPTQSTTLEFSLDKDTSLLVSNSSTFQATWWELAQSNTFNSPPLQSSRPASWEEPRPRRQRRVLMLVLMTNERSLLLLHKKINITAAYGKVVMIHSFHKYSTSLIFSFFFTLKSHYIIPH